MNHHCSTQFRRARRARIVVVAAVLVSPLSVAVPVAASHIPRVNDRECPSTAPYKVQVDNDVFCQTPAEFCARHTWREDCQPSATTTTLAPGQTRPRYADDYVDVPGPVDGSRCPPSNPVAAQVDNRMICYTLLGFCETVNPTWYDEARGLWCPGATTTTTVPPTTTTTSVSRGAAGESGGPDVVDPSQLVEVRAARGGSAFVVPPDVLSVQGGGATGRSVAVTIRATRRGSRTVTFSIRARGNRPIEIPSSLSRRGYRLSIFVDGVQMLVIPPSR